MKVLICIISLIGVASATFGRLNLLGGGGLNSLFGGGGDAGKPNLGSGKGSGGGNAIVEENYVSIIDQLGPGKVIERGVLRKRIPKSGGGIGGGGPAIGGAYNAGGGAAHNGQFIKVLDEGVIGGGPGTIVNVYGDASGGYGGGIESGHGGYALGGGGGGGGGSGGVTVIRVIHEHAGGASSGGFAGEYNSHGGHGSSSGSGGVQVYKIIESTSYGGADSSSHGGFSNAVSGGYSDAGSSGWAPISGHNGW